MCWEWNCYEVFVLIGFDWEQFLFDLFLLGFFCLVGELCVGSGLFCDVGTSDYKQTNKQTNKQTGALYTFIETQWITKKHPLLGLQAPV